MAWDSRRSPRSGAGLVFSRNSASFLGRALAQLQRRRLASSVLCGGLEPKVAASTIKLPVGRGSPWRISSPHSSVAQRSRSSARAPRVSSAKAWAGEHVSARAARGDHDKELGGFLWRSVITRAYPSRECRSPENVQAAKVRPVGLEPINSSESQIRQQRVSGLLLRQRQS